MTNRRTGLEDRPATLDPIVYKSVRNIDKVTVSPVADLNALAVLVPKKLLVTRAALDAIRDRSKKPSANGGEV